MGCFRTIVFTLFLVSAPSYAAKPAWYGSGMGPAASGLIAQEIGKLHPFAGGSALFDLENSTHRYARARMAVASDRKLQPATPSRFGPASCAALLLERFRSSLAGKQGPLTDVSDIVDFRDRELMTYRYEVDPRLAFANPEMMATLFHGVGALHLSHAGVTAPLVRTLSYSQDRRHKEIAKVLKKEGNEPVRILAETLDLPMAGNFLGHFEFDKETSEKWGTPEAVGRTLGTHLKRRKTLHPHLPSVGFGFSAGAAFAGMPELRDQFDLLVLVGPVIPGTHYPESRDRLFELADQLFVPNWEAFHWADTAIAQMNWGDIQKPFPQPTLILVGEHDTDVPESTMRWLEQQASASDHVHFHRIKDAEHNVLKGRAVRDSSGTKLRDYDPTEAFAIIHRFLRQYADPSA